MDHISCLVPVQMIINGCLLRIDFPVEFSFHNKPVVGMEYLRGKSTSPPNFYPCIKQMTLCTSPGGMPIRENIRRETDAVGRTELRRTDCGPFESEFTLCCIAQQNGETEVLSLGASDSHQ